MPLVVMPPVAQIDPAEEGDVVLGSTRVAQYDEFLVVRAQDTDSHVEKALPSRRLDLRPETTVL